MELKEVYEKIGGDYDDVVRRLMGEACEKVSPEISG